LLVPHVHSRLGSSVVEERQERQVELAKALGAKTLYSKLLGVNPTWTKPYYVGFDVVGQHVSLDPHGHSQGMTGPVGYYHVHDIKKI
jgi:hypothetical protein